MKLILYSGEPNSVENRLLNIVQSSIESPKILTHRKIDHLLSMYQNPGFDNIILILLISNREELDDILLIRTLFFDYRIIIILPDFSKETITLAHKLYPRYMSSQDSDFSDIAAVLDKMQKAKG